MARTKGARDKKPRKNSKKIDYQEEYLKAQQIISGMDEMIHNNKKDLREMGRLLKEQGARLERQEDKADGPWRDNFDLAVTIMNTTRHKLKQLARQASREKNPIMASVFEFLYHDMGNLAKYKRLTDRHEQGKDHIPDPVPPVDFTIL